jgi:hypothetical protein
MTQYIIPLKSPGVAVMLALIAGLFGFWGIGHIYAGRAGKGVVLLIAGIVIGALFWASVILTLILIGIFGVIVFGLLLFGGWLWQTYDAYLTAREYNEFAIQHGRKPW